MRVVGAGLASLVVVVLLAFLPAAGAATPYTGTVTTCSSNYACNFVFNTTAGMGWANGSSTTYITPGTLTLKLPGEANTTTGLPYSTYINKLTGTYTYWTIGTFLGTDVNTGTVVYGTTNSNFTITCVGHSGRGGGCNYIYTTDNGSIAVTLTVQQMTATSYACTPTTTSGARVSCTVTVTDVYNSSKIPTGKMHFTVPYLSKMSNHGSCTLSSTGVCKFTWTPPVGACGPYTLTATYAGTTAYYTSVGSAVITTTDGC